jgi:hypothetical protein
MAFCDAPRFSDGREALIGEMTLQGFDAVVIVGANDGSDAAPGSGLVIVSATDDAGDPMGDMILVCATEAEAVRVAELLPRGASVETLRAIGFTDGGSIDWA